MFRRDSLNIYSQLRDAYDYCCSLGMRLMEISPTHASEISAKIVGSNYNAFKPYLSTYLICISVQPGSLLIGETYQVGGTTAQNTFCRSKRLIASSECAYSVCTEPSCLPDEQNILQFTAATFPYGITIYSSAATRFLCENP